MTHSNDREESTLKILLIEDVAADAELIKYELRKAHIRFESRCVASKKALLAELMMNSRDVSSRTKLVKLGRVCKLV